MFTLITKNEMLYILCTFLVIEIIDILLEKKLCKNHVLRKHFLNVFVLLLSIFLIRFVFSIKTDLKFLPSISDTLIWSILASFGIRDVEDIFIDIHELGGYVPKFLMDELVKIDNSINDNESE